MAHGEFEENMTTAKPKKKRTTPRPNDSSSDTKSAFFDELANTAKIQPVNLGKIQKGLAEGELGRRASQRYALRMTALIVTEMSTFRTTSINVSIAGVLLEEMIPQHVIGKVFDFLLIDEEAQGNDKYLRFKATAVGTKLTQRVQFVSSSPETQARLGQILQDLTAIVD